MPRFFLPLRAKILLIFTVVLLLTGIVGFKTINEMEKLTAELDRTKTAVFDENRKLQNIHKELQDWDRTLENHILSKDAQEMQKYERELNEESSALLRQVDLLSKNQNISLYHQDVIRDIKLAFKNATDDQEKVLAASRGGDKVIARSLYDTDVFPDIGKAVQSLDLLAEDTQMQLDKVLVNSDETFNQDLRRMLATTFIAFAFFLILGLGLVRLIVRNVNKIAASVEAAEGWLNYGEKQGEAFPAPIEQVPSRDEIGYLAGVFNKLLASLKHNISDLRKAQQSLRDNNEALESFNRGLEDSYQELSRFAAVAAHDLRAPLSNLLISVELLKEGLDGKLDQTQLDLVAFITSGIERMSKQISSLYQLSKIETTAVEREAIDLDHVVSDLIKGTLALEITNTGATFNVSRLGEAFANEAQVGSVFQNLIENALRYRNPQTKPKITISSKNVANDLKIEVSDNGIGIKKEDQALVFKMFSRLHKDMFKEGLGVGLSHCKKIVERLGGEMGVESEYGKGSTFWFTLPNAQ